MVKLLFKTLLVSVVFFGSGVIIMHLGKAWNDSTLQATSGDELTAERRNALVDKTGGKVYESDWFNVTTSSDVNKINDHNTYVINHNLGAENVEVTVLGRVSEGGEIIRARALDLYYNGISSYCRGYVIRSIQPNQLTIGVPRSNCTNNYIFYSRDISNITTQVASGQYKVIVKALN
ncbi:MAG: hypothetical protein V3575_04990 [Candidatus Absconditabacteria bacterium]